MLSDSVRVPAPLRVVLIVFSVTLTACGFAYSSGIRAAFPRRFLSMRRQVGRLAWLEGSGRRDSLDLNPRAERQRGDGDRRAGPRRGPHAFAVDRVDRREIVDVHEVDRLSCTTASSVSSAAARTAAEIVEDSPSLRGNPRPRRSCRSPGRSDLTAAEDEAVDADCLAVGSDRRRRVSGDDRGRIEHRALSRSFGPGVLPLAREARAECWSERPQRVLRRAFRARRVAAGSRPTCARRGAIRALCAREPGDLRRRLPAAPPDEAEPFDAIFADFERLILPGITHWNHPRFFAYFSISAGAGDDLAEALGGRARRQRDAVAHLARRDRTGRRVLRLAARDARAAGRPLTGIIYDTASISGFTALAAARESLGLDIRERGMAGPRRSCRRCACTSRIKPTRISRRARSRSAWGARTSSRSGRRRVPRCGRGVRAAIDDDLARGRRPMCVVATVGTTSTTSSDPVAAIREITRRARRVAARRRRLRGTGRDLARVPLAARSGARRGFAGRQPAQVALRTDRSLGALRARPANCCGARSVSSPIT